MSEYELLNLMYMAFTQNAIYFVGMIFLTFISFNLANSLRAAINRGDVVRNIAKILLSTFVIFVGFFFLNTRLIGGGILQSYTEQLIAIDAPSGMRLSAIASAPGAIGSPLQVIFHIFIVIFQLVMIWFPKPK